MHVCVVYINFCRSEYGVIDKCYGEGDLELYNSKLNLSVERWETLPLLSVRQAARLLNRQNSFQGGICNCKLGCKSHKCACHQKGAICSTKCHQGSLCSNCPQTDRPCSENCITINVRADQCKSPPRKKSQESTSVSVITITDTDATDEEIRHFSRSWIPDLHLDLNDKAILETGQWLTDRHVCAAKNLLKKQFPHICGLQAPFLE